MSPDATWPELSMIERRILGVLVEKSQTTPEAYPLSLNALITGCNQKSNRDPVMSLDEFEVEEALDKLRPKGLVLVVTGSRVDRWRHQLYDAWQLNKVQAAVMAELLLRGPQSIGDLRGRASRMEPIESLEDLRDVLKPLVERKLVVWLSPENRRGAMVSHGFHVAQELERLRTTHVNTGADEPAPRAASPVNTASPVQAKNEEIRAEIAGLRTELESLQREVGRLGGLLAEMRKELGMNPPS